MHEPSSKWPPPYLHGGFKPVTDCTATNSAEPRRVTLSGGVPAAATSCTGLPPPSEVVCLEQQCGGAYSWFVGEWGACSTACGNGTQDRTVQCLDMERIPFYSETCVAAGLGRPPLASRQCNNVPCPRCICR